MPWTSLKARAGSKAEPASGAKVSGGVSNVSFSFRGQRADARGHSHCVPVPRHPGGGMDMGIVNAGMIGVGTTTSWKPICANW